MTSVDIEKFLKKLTIDQLRSIYNSLKKIILSGNFQEKNPYIKGYLEKEAFLKAEWGSNLERQFYIFSILYFLEELSVELLNKFVRLLDIYGMDYFKIQLFQVLNGKR